MLGKVLLPPRPPGPILINSTHVIDPIPLVLFRAFSSIYDDYADGVSRIPPPQIQSIIKIIRNVKIILSFTLGYTYINFHASTMFVTITDI